MEDWKLNYWLIQNLLFGFVKTFNKKNKKMGFIMLEEAVGRGVGRTVGGGSHIRITYPFRVSQPRIVESTPPPPRSIIIEKDRVDRKWPVVT